MSYCFASKTHAFRTSVSVGDITVMADDVEQLHVTYNNNIHRLILIIIISII